MMNKAVVHICIVVGLCMIAGSNGADESKAKTSAEGESNKPSLPPIVTQSCKDTAYPGLCRLMIGTDPGSKNADLPKIALVSIRVATFSAIENVQLIAEMKKEKSRNKDEEVFKCYENCSDCYSGAVEAFDDSLLDLLNKDYAGVREQIKRAGSYRETCQNCFAQTKKKDAKDSMAALNEMLGKLCSISTSLVNALDKPKPS